MVADRRRVEQKGGTGLTVPGSNGIQQDTIPDDGSLLTLYTGNGFLSSPEIQASMPFIRNISQVEKGEGA